MNEFNAETYKANRLISLKLFAKDKPEMTVLDENTIMVNGYTHTINEYIIEHDLTHEHGPKLCVSSRLGYPSRNYELTYAVFYLMYEGRYTYDEGAEPIPSYTICNTEYFDNMTSALIAFSMRKNNEHEAFQPSGYKFGLVSFVRNF